MVALLVLIYDGPAEAVGAGVYAKNSCHNEL